MAHIWAAWMISTILNIYIPFAVYMLLSSFIHHVSFMKAGSYFESTSVLSFTSIHKSSRNFFCTECKWGGELEWVTLHLVFTMHYLFAKVILVNICLVNLTMSICFPFQSYKTKQELCWWSSVLPPPFSSLKKTQHWRQKCFWPTAITCHLSNNGSVCRERITKQIFAG